MPIEFRNISVVFPECIFSKINYIKGLLFFSSATATIQVFFLIIYKHPSPIRGMNRAIPDPAEGVVLGDVDSKVPAGTVRLPVADT